MTLILAAKDKKGKVFIGADTRASNGHTYFDGTDKLIPQHNYIVGYSGSFRIGQIIRNHPDKFKEVNSDADMFVWVNALRLLLIEYGFQKEAGDKNEPDHNNVLLILAAPHTTYSVECNYQFHALERYAVGCGYNYGLGYFDGQPATTPMKKRIELAISHTADLMVGVSPTCQVMEVGKEKKP
jgi:ATP-dependent protease HslVU (ClpYQ) peptidase subunit